MPIRIVKLVSSFDKGGQIGEGNDGIIVKDMRGNCLFLVSSFFLFIYVELNYSILLKIDFWGCFFQCIRMSMLLLKKIV